MLQESYTLLNFNFIMICIIHKILVLLENHLNDSIGNIFKSFFKEYKTLLFKKFFFSQNI